MKLREIKQHHLPAILTIAFLFLVDTFSYYISYLIANSNAESHVGMPFPLRVYLVVIVIIYLFKNYDPSPRVSRGKDAKNIIQSIYIMGILYTLGKILIKDITIDQSQYNLILLHLFLIIDIPLRFITRSIQRLFLIKGIGGRYTILLGAKEDAQHLASEILSHPTLGFDLNGYFNQSESKEMNRYCSYLGTPEKIYSYVETHNIHEMIIVLDNHEHDKLLEIIGRYEMLDICIKIIPDMYESISGQVRIDILRGIPLMDINPDIMTEFQSLLKRIMDIVLSLGIMILLLPLFIFALIIISFSTPGGVFYKQNRLGKNGIIFKLYKLRTMYINSETVVESAQSGENDSQITPFGKILRQYQLDLIPQLYNVLKGQMSIIGPSPEHPKVIEALMKEISYYTHRMKVKPGITGWAQVRGSYDASLDDVYTKLKHDFYYIENMSLFLDMKIIILTMWRMIKGRGH